MDNRGRVVENRRLDSVGSWPSYLRCAILVIVAGFFSSGCKVGPDYTGPPCPAIGQCYPEATSDEESVVNVIPDQGCSEDTPAVGGDGESIEVVPIGELGPELANWWTALNDPVLNELVVCVVQQNPDLLLAAERIFESRARRGTVASSLFPQIDTNTYFTHEKRPAGGLFSGSVRNWWSWSTDLSWEIDVFGRLRRLLESSDADIGEKQELYRDTLILLIAETATTYVEARSHQEQMAIIASNIDIQKETVRLVTSRHDNDKADMLDVSQAKGSLKGVEAGYPLSQILYRRSINRLSVLTGSPPGAIDALMSDPQPIPDAPEYVTVGIPAELLQRRPDVRGVERKLAAQTARIGGAVGELYPQFSITGSFGLAANEFGALWNNRAIATGITPAVRWNILNFGRYRCNVWVQESLQRQYTWEYENTVLRAAEEVDNALVSYKRGKERRDLLRESVDYYAEAVRLSQIKYQAGAVDLQRVLNSQESLLASQNLLVLNRTDVVRSFITLYRALGGGWQIPVQQIAAATLAPTIAEEQPEHLPPPAAEP